MPSIIQWLLIAGLSAAFWMTHTIIFVEGCWFTDLWPISIDAFAWVYGRGSSSEIVVALIVSWHFLVTG